MPGNSLRDSAKFHLNTKSQRRLSFLINFGYIGLITILSVLAVRYLLLWMMPFVLAFIVAAFLQNPLHWLVKKTRISKKFFSVVLVVLVILLLAGIVAVVCWQLVIYIIDFFSDSSNVQLIEDSVMHLSNRLQMALENFSASLPEQATATLQQGIESISSLIVEYLSKIFTTAATGLASFATTKLPLLFVSFIIWVIASIFLTIDYQKVMAFFLRQVPERHSQLAHTIRDLCSNTLFKLLRAYLLLMFITFLELTIGLSILSVPYSLLVAALVALIDILPVLGTGTILIPWAFISLALGNVRLFIGLGLMYVIITIVRNILEPRLVSQQIGLNPLVTLFFMYLGLRSVGIFAMILFPVIVMILVQLQNSGKIRLWK